MGILQQELRRENISDDERREILDCVLRLVAEARDESEKDRTFRTRLTYAATGSLVFVGGFAVFAWTRGKNTDVITRGVEIIGKAAAKAV
jgi:hypothetical protein